MEPNEFMEYEQDVREAQIAFPGMEMREAYVKFMTEIRKQEPRPMLSTGDKSLDAVKASIKQTLRKPCDQEGCKGEKVLTGVCEGCAAGKKGFKTVWECEECLHREFSTKTFFEVYEEESKKEK